MQMGNYRPFLTLREADQVVQPYQDEFYVASGAALPSNDAEGDWMYRQVDGTEFSDPTVYSLKAFDPLNYMPSNSGLDENGNQQVFKSHLK